MYSEKEIDSALEDREATIELIDNLLKVDKDTPVFDTNIGTSMNELFN